MRAGLLRHRLTIQSPATTRDAHGGVVKTWQTKATVWGSVEPITDREYFDAPRVKATSTNTIKMRGRITVHPTDRIILQGRIFQVDSVGNFREKGLETTIQATETVGAGLSATLALSATAGVADSTAFVITATAAGGTPDYTYSTNWGDGTVTTGPTSSHTFGAAGPYTITLTVRDALGATVTVQGQVSVTESASTALSASLAVNTTTATAGITPITATVTPLNGTAPYTVSIAWGDGTTTAATSGTKVYSTGGTKTITATVTDAAGSTVTQTQAITVTAALAASVSLSPSSGTAGTTSITATASASGGAGGYTYSTAWGDGSTSSGGTPTHTYAAAGSYTVTLTVTDSASATATATQAITIAAASPGTGTTPSWGSWPLHASARKVYVSATGSDSNDGLSDTTPKLTIAAGYALIRNGFGDQLCLKAGDSFVNQGIDWDKRGLSATYPAMLTSYGSGARPIIIPDVGDYGFDHTAGADYSHVAIVGVDFYARTRDPGYGTPNAATATGIWWYGPGTNITIEDCRVRFFSTNIVFQTFGAGASSINNVTLRGNVIVDAWADSNTAHAQGCYLSEYINTIVIEDNVFDHNGWNETATRAERTVYNHNIYLDNEIYSSANTVRRNILGRGGSHGIQLRPGGVIADNLAVGNAIGILLGGGDGFATSSPGGVPVTCTNNVVTESTDIDGSNPRGFGFDVVNISGGTMSGNIITQDASAAPYTNAHGISIDNPVSGLSLTNNIVWNWHVPKVFEAGVGVTESGNYYGSFGGANTPGYTAPNRTVGTYHGSIGGTATTAAYLTAARAQTKASWSANLAADAVNAYIRAGFATA